LIIRFGALGDLCICGWFISGLTALTEGRNTPDTRVTLVTKARFAPLAERFSGVDEVVALPEGGIVSLWRLARVLKSRNFDRILDAHSVLRSHVLTTLMGRRPDARLHKDTRARLALIRTGETSDTIPSIDLDRSLLDRFIALSASAPIGRAKPRPPLGHRRPPTEGLFRVGLAPGARWVSKRWHDRKFSDLLSILREAGAPAVTLILGPDELVWFDGGPLAEAAAHYPGLDVIREAELPDVADALGRCHVTVTNDSGLLHLSEAVGTPVVALFGPTVRAFGYFPLLPDSRVLEKSLDCRPCSRTGSKPCHRGDLACLEEITPEEVGNAVLAFRPGGRA